MSNLPPPGSSSPPPPPPSDSPGGFSPSGSPGGFSPSGSPGGFSPSGSSGWPSPSPFGAPTGAPPYGLPSGPVVSTTSYIETRSPRKRGRAKVLLAGIVAVAAIGGGFVAVRAASGGNGPSSPDAAVREMLDAVEKEDVIGVLDAMAPGERSLLLDIVQDTTTELKRLGVASGSMELRGFPGVDVAFDNVQLATTKLDDGLATVAFTGGTATGTADLGKLPYGKLLLDLGFDGVAPSGTRTATGNLADANDLHIATVKTDDGWRVSLFFTIAEAARASSGAALPAASAAVADIPSASPDDAVRSMLTALTDLDLERAIGLMPPDEMQALKRYAPLFLPSANDAVADLKSGGDFAVKLDDIQLESTTKGDRAVVKVKGVRATITVEGDTLSIETRDGCTILATPDGQEQKMCGGDTSKLTEGADIPPELQQTIDDLGARMTSIDTGLVAVKVGDGWYMSPVRSLTDPFIAVMKALDEKTLRDLIGVMGELGSATIGGLGGN